ncbi:MAG: aldehyde dehydrogenase family protein [Truepera sp.]|nr:aldehyde dehydrogenase family protein [Truepera sp.]
MPSTSVSNTVFDKYSGEPIAAIAEASKEEADAAVKAASDAFNSEILPPHTRFEVLARASQLVEVHAAELAKLLVREVGKTIFEARVEVASAIASILNSAEEAKRIHGEMIPIDGNAGSEQKLAFTLRVPSGPVCAITPFNSPLNIAAHKISSALAAGSSVVIKPSEVAPLSTIRLLELFSEAGLPSGYLNAVFGGATLGEQLCQDERFSRYSFTGGTAAGRKVAAAVGLRPVTLELGPAAPTFVHEDADLDRAAKRCQLAAFAIAGQVCTSVQRLFVHETILTQFLDRFLPLVAALKIGDPAREDTDVGPMISDAAAERAEEWVQKAVQGGAHVLVGGHRTGRMFAPTVLTGVTLEMDVYRREAFAPVVCIVPYTDLVPAISQANDLGGGLQAGIFTRDLKVAFEYARRVRAGAVMVNDTSRFRVANMPFGGVGESGIGREGPKYAIQELTDEKTVVVHL